MPVPQWVLLFAPLPNEYFFDIKELLCLWVYFQSVMINQFGQIPKWRMLYIIKLFFLIMNLPNVNNLAIKKKKKVRRRAMISRWRSTLKLLLFSP